VDGGEASHTRGRRRLDSVALRPKTAAMRVNRPTTPSRSPSDRRRRAALALNHASPDRALRTPPREQLFFGLKSYDAVHAATALYSGARGIVTLDADFALLPAYMAPIYTGSAALVRSCRATRGGRATTR
jgi:predicted nucleic acid-binding protein